MHSNNGKQWKTMINPKIQVIKPSEIVPTSFPVRPASFYENTQERRKSESILSFGPRAPRAKIQHDPIFT